MGAVATVAMFGTSATVTVVNSFFCVELAEVGVSLAVFTTSTMGVCKAGDEARVAMEIE